MLSARTLVRECLFTQKGPGICVTLQKCQAGKVRFLLCLRPVAGGGEGLGTVPHPSGALGEGPPASSVPLPGPGVTLSCLMGATRVYRRRGQRPRAGLACRRAAGKVFPLGSNAAAAGLE